MPITVDAMKSRESSVATEAYPSAWHGAQGENLLPQPGHALKDTFDRARDILATPDDTEVFICTRLRQGTLAAVVLLDLHKVSALVTKLFGEGVNHCTNAMLSLAQDTACSARDAAAQAVTGTAHRAWQLYTWPMRTVYGSLGLPPMFKPATSATREISEPPQTPALQAAHVRGEP